MINLEVARAMHDFQEQCQVLGQRTKRIGCVRCDNAFFVIFLKIMCSKTSIRFSFYDIQNNQGLG